MVGLAKVTLEMKSFGGTGPGGLVSRYFPRKHDVILAYGKSHQTKHIPLEETINYDKPFFLSGDVVTNKDGTYPVQVYIRDVWDNEIKAVINGSKNRVGYPTQKPVELLESDYSSKYN